jgi:hypothetical protein
MQNPAALQKRFKCGREPHDEAETDTLSKAKAALGRLLAKSKMEPSFTLFADGNDSYYSQ